MQKIIIPALLFITPLFYLTSTPNFFSTPKQVIIILGVIILLLQSAYEIFSTRKLKQNASPLRYSLLAFTLAIVANIVFNKVSRVESIVGPGSLYISLCLWAYFVSMESQRKLKDHVIFAILGSSTVLALHTLAQLTFLYKSSFIPEFMQSRAFTLTGNVLTTFILLTIGSVLSVFLTIKHHESKVVYAISSILNIIAMVALGAVLLPGGELALTLLPMRASWSIALDAMKSPITFMIGVGATNFPIFYGTVKPLFLNATAFWNTIPSSASSELLQIMTTMGMVGLISFISIPIVALKHVKSSDVTMMAIKIIALLSFISLFLVPATIPVLLIFFTSAGLLASHEPTIKELTLPSSVILSLIILSLVATISYFGSRVLMAEISLRDAQKALSNNDGKALYENSLRAAQLVPQMATYRLSYAQVNLSLATALSQKESLSDTERSNVSSLVAQAVAEAKAALSLSPNNPLVWQNLGSIYQKLINVAEGSDKFAVDAYAQAVTLDPANPTLRIEYGGLLYQLIGLSKDQKEQAALFGRAQNEFQTAIQLKPDYPNAYYNLAKLLEMAKDYENSYIVMQKAISLLGPDNPNLGQANAELEAIKAKVPKTTPAPSAKPSASPAPVGEENPETSIQTPAPLPSPIDGGPLDIPVAP